MQQPKIAIVIPVYKHSVLVGEAISCALAQQADFSIAIVIVNDGCRFLETDRICRDFALAHPERIVYLARANGGLSAARNTGIEFALKTWDSVEAIYLLDADNRISPHTVARSWEILNSDPQIGWVYPTINMFGAERDRDFDYRGEYSVLRHLRFNICEAGSAIDRAVLEAGCRYDESMKLGFEDWEFWWQAIKAGFRGRHLPDSGFQYRKRFESMLSDSERNGKAIEHYIRQKHRDLLTHRHILELEHREAPRYAIFLQDTGRVHLASDPACLETSMTLEEFNLYYSRAVVMPVRYYRPYFMVFTSTQTLNFLQEQKLLHWLFWKLERGEESANFATVVIDTDEDETAYQIRQGKPAPYPSVGETDCLVMTKIDIMDSCLRDSSDDWIQSLLTSNPAPNIFKLQVILPQKTQLPAMGGALYHLLSTFKFLRRHLNKQDLDRPWDWHGNYLPFRSRMFEDARLALDCGAIYPRSTASETKNIGFILSILEFGGVEKVALNLAKVFYEDGWQVHLFVFNSRMQALPDWADIFTTINFYYEPQMSPWQGKKYLGTKGDAWSQQGNYLTLKGLLSWLDVAVNCHNATSNDVMGILRKSGVTTIASLHVHDLTPWNRPAGHTYLTLGYEHAYDLIVPCSEHMASWCHGMGIPEDKLVVVSNASGYPLTESEVETILIKRKQRGLNSKLRVLFIGRFARQKGLDRLVEIVTSSREQKLSIEWRLVGKNIIPGEDSAEELQAIADAIKPPALTTSELNQLYEWADVLLLPSYWEGLPLTVLEAMRLGVVVCASDVGAVAEVIDRDKTGVLIPNYAGDIYVETAVAALRSLSENPTRLQELSLKAAEVASQRSWSLASVKLLQQLDNLVRE
jgi:glycosyltransferase involved in cell wall biosynthesis